MVSGELALGPQDPSSTMKPFPAVPHLCPWYSLSSGSWVLPPYQVGTVGVPFPVDNQAHCSPGLTVSLYLCPWSCCKDRRAGQLALPGGCSGPMESCLSPRPWQEGWQLQCSSCPRRSETAPGVSSGAATGLGRPQTLMTSAWSRVSRPHGPSRLCPLSDPPPRPRAMRTPRAASKEASLMRVTRAEALPTEVQGPGQGAASVATVSQP